MTFFSDLQQLIIKLPYIFKCGIYRRRNPTKIAFYMVLLLQYYRHMDIYLDIH